MGGAARGGTRAAGMIERLPRGATPGVSSRLGTGGRASTAPGRPPGRKAAPPTTGRQNRTSAPSADLRAPPATRPLDSPGIFASTPSRSPAVVDIARWKREAAPATAGVGCRDTRPAPASSPAPAAVVGHFERRGTGARQPASVPGAPGSRSRSAYSSAPAGRNPVRSPPPAGAGSNPLTRICHPRVVGVSRCLLVSAT